MSPSFLAALAALVVAGGVGVGAWWLARRAAAGRRELARAIHDQALRLDRRCDVLQRSIDELAVARRIDRLHLSVARLRGRGVLGAAASTRLDDAVAELARDHAAELEADAGTPR